MVRDTSSNTFHNSNITLCLCTVRWWARSSTVRYGGHNQPWTSEFLSPLDTHGELITDFLKSSEEASVFLEAKRVNKLHVDSCHIEMWSRADLSKHILRIWQPRGLSNSVYQWLQKSAMSQWFRKPPKYQERVLSLVWTMKSLQLLCVEST